MGDLTTNFNVAEFACKCNCGDDAIDLNLVAILQAVRDIYGKPMRITSGVRCEAHNRAVGAKPTSAHTKGQAVDVACTDSHLRFLLVRAALRAGCTRIGFHKEFIHVDTSIVLPQQVIWDY